MFWCSLTIWIEGFTVGMSGFFSSGTDSFFLVDLGEMECFNQGRESHLIVR